jgi:hypothetical protein
MISIEAARAIIAKEDPRHVAYYNNEPAIKADVERAFLREHPGNFDPWNGSTVLEQIGQDLGEQPYEPPVKLFATLLK